MEDWNKPIIKVIEINETLSGQEGEFDGFGSSKPIDS